MFRAPIDGCHQKAIPLCPMNIHFNYHSRTCCPSSLLPCLLTSFVLQLAPNIQQCLEILRKTHKEGIFLRTHSPANYRPAAPLVPFFPSSNSKSRSSSSLSGFGSGDDKWTKWLGPTVNVLYRRVDVVNLGSMGRHSMYNGSDSRSPGCEMPVGRG